MTAWETLESNAADVFDTLLLGPNSNRAAFAAFISVTSSSARTEMLQAAIDRSLAANDALPGHLKTFATELEKFGARRNEIAHGRVCNLGEFGFYLAPNNTLTRKWANGAAKYQYTADDLSHYLSHFIRLSEDAGGVVRVVKTILTPSKDA